MVRDSVASHVMRLLVGVARESGVAEHELAFIEGVTGPAVDDDLTRFPTSSLLRVWELIAAADPVGGGARAIAAADRGRLHVWDYLVTGAPTLAAGFADAGEYLSVICDPVARISVVEDGSRLTVQHDNLSTGTEVDNTINEYALGLILRRARDARGDGLRPVRVDFAHTAPRRHGHLDEVFGTGNIHFGQGGNRITFLDAESEPATRPFDPELQRVMRMYARSIIDSARPAPDWRESFRGAIGEALADSHGRGTSLEEVAHRLAMSPRTLQRRLAEHETTWREELEAVRFERATRLLRETDLSLQSIAGRLGYTDHRTLRRAFQRWTGQTPDAFRRAA
ncbi:helix-turn-helix domain-containing protein [Nocardia sp. NPDC056000]|uniref:helix-turn-helix transcriptional regulator n=1 Tax=Nocardia sp. NPDC056000 TaxID=3345674 RepID=UPI0035D8849D